MSDPAADEALPLLLDTVRRFARRVDPAALEAAGRIPDALVAAAGEAGLFGLTIPAAYGGLGLPLRGACAVVRELARADRSVAIMVGLHAGLGAHALCRHGTPAQRARWLPAMAAGERVASFAATEPGAGSDLQSLRAIAAPEGDVLRLCGEKAYVTNGGFAGIFTVLVRTPGLGGERATSLVCVPRETPGLSVGPEEDKLGIRASSTVPLQLDDARVPRDHLLGAPGAGLDLTHESLARGRVVMAAGCAGTARFALDAALAHVATRRQFRRALADFDAVRLQVATMDATLLAMEALVGAAADALDGARPDADAALLSVAAKVVASEGADAVCDASVQLHGAMGFLEPTGVARALRDARITRIFEGANDVLLVHLGASLLGRAPADPRGGALDPLDELARRLDATVTAHRKSHGVRATQRQLLALRVARAAVSLAAAREVRRLPATPAVALAETLLLRDAHLSLDALATLDADERAAADVCSAALERAASVRSS
ncbi:MAG: acyl-CoA dehydrogenase family protein [Polyangiales bacterium]